MANAIPCPNPACTYTFTMAQLQTAPSVQCPKCGFKLQGRGPKATPPASKASPKTPVPPPKPARPKAAPPVAKPAPPVAKPPPPPRPKAHQTPLPPAKAVPMPPAVPLATPVARAVPPPADPGIDVDLVDDAPPPAAAPFDLPAADTGPLIKAPKSKRSVGRTLSRVVMVLAALGFSVCVVAGLLVGVLVSFGFFSLEELAKGQVDPNNLFKEGAVTYTAKVRNIKGAEETAFKLVLPKNVWAADSTRKTQLAAVSAFKHTKDDVWFAVAARDYGTQKPRDSELVRGAIEKLQGHFGENLEFAAKSEPAEVAGLPAQKLPFKGQIGTVLWHGEVRFFPHHGFGYWLFFAGPTAEELQPHVEELTKDGGSFAAATTRAGWREQAPKMEAFAASNGAFSLHAPEGIWEKHAQPQVEFESGVLYLFGRFQKEKDNLKNAHLQVFTMEKQPDLKEAVKSARTMLEKLKQEQNSNARILATEEEGATSLEGAVEDIGPRPGRIVDLKLQFNETPSRYYLMAVINEPDHCYVLLCDCTWQSRQIWREDFREMLRSLKVLKAA